MIKSTCLLVWVLFYAFSLSAQLIPFGTSWKYLDNGSNQGTAWRSTTFNDNTWRSGAAELGYGDGDEKTIVHYGNNAKNKYITTYFRKAISITDLTQFASFTGKLKRDDGAVVYINGKEVYRTNLPTGTLSYLTKASSATDDGKSILSFTISKVVFATGTNVVAIEIHQDAVTSSDISFNFELLGHPVVNQTPPAASLTRGPYLQMVSETAATIRWRTTAATDSKVDLGTSYGNYITSASNSTSTTEHEVRVNGLLPDTKYYYRFGSTSQVLQNGQDNFFTTAPGDTTLRKIRVAAFGDCGRPGSVQASVLNAYLNFAGTAPAELLLLLGDNAYTTGTDAEYQANFFTPYSTTILKNHALFPAPGNHDYYSSAQTARDGAYYKNFSLPKAAECGGLASGTEAYYSFNWGNIHFVSLDSYGQESPGNTRLYDTLGPQVTWLKQDLAANARKWTIVYWHHPPFSRGTHNSDAESELINIRTNFVRIIERYGVDLVLCGHSHNYERSYLLKDYYGTEESFNPGLHTASASSGKYNGSDNSCPYLVNEGQVNHGSVYVVAGSSAQSGLGVNNSFPHNALPFATTDGGIFYFEVEDNRLDAKFVRFDGVIYDQFTIMKGVKKNTAITATSGSTLTLTASWIGNYQWSNGASSRSITITPDADISYTVTDGRTCLQDVFDISVIATTAALLPAVIQLEKSKATAAFEITPYTVMKGQVVTIRSNTNKTKGVTLLDENGRTVRRFKVAGTSSIETNTLTAGVYFLAVDNKKTLGNYKLLIKE